MAFEVGVSTHQRVINVFNSSSDPTVGYTYGKNQKAAQNVRLIGGYVVVKLLNIIVFGFKIGPINVIFSI